MVVGLYFIYTDHDKQNFNLNFILYRIASVLYNHIEDTIYADKRIIELLKSRDLDGIVKPIPNNFNKFDKVYIFADGSLNPQKNFMIAELMRQFNDKTEIAILEV